MRFHSPLRYPGGKAFLAKEFERILAAIDIPKPTYVEPYAGGAGAALALLFANKVSKIVINDKDPRIFAFWKSITEHPHKFVAKIRKTPVNITEWKKQKKIYLDPNSCTFDKGFAAFYLNRTNRSGLMNGGPIGGMNQNGAYTIEARFNKIDLAKRVLKIGRYKKRIEVTNEEGIDLTNKYLGKHNVFIYLDPPYFVQGAMLYFNEYGEQQHKRLAKLLNKNRKKNWVLTYDERTKIRNFYIKRHRERRPFHYRVRDSRKARELMIFSDTTFV
jgi:DNA adenine methylase